jgi:hypothetical protein
LLDIIPAVHPSPHTEVCGSPDQAACYHLLGLYIWGFISDSGLGWLQSMELTEDISKHDIKQCKASRTLKASHYKMSLNGPGIKQFLFKAYLSMALQPLRILAAFTVS